jgi:hypothetical protein
MKMIRRRYSQGLATVISLLALAGLVASPASASGGFGDSIPDRFYTEAVQWMVDNEITTGTTPTCFSPAAAVTRGQAAAFMWRMENEPASGAPHTFTDVSAAWQQEPVSWMVKAEVTTGTSPSTYSPDENLTRGQLAALLHRLAGEPAAPPPTDFSDVVKQWQVTPVGWMVKEGITTGTSPTTFSPEDTVTRGQLATFFHRYKGEPEAVVDLSSPRCEREGHLVGTWLADDVDGSDITMSIDPAGRFQYHDTATIGRCAGAAQSRDGAVAVAGDKFTVDALTTCHEFMGNPSFTYDTERIPYTYDPGSDTITLDLDGTCHWRAGTDKSVCS